MTVNRQMPGELSFSGFQDKKEEEIKTMQGEVLVAILNNKDDLNILYEQHWYRIPVASVNKLLKERWPPRWLAFYQTKVFGKHAYAVRYYAEVIDIQEARRWDLFPDEPPNSKQKNYIIN